MNKIKSTVDFAEWAGTADIKNLPSKVYAYWFGIYTSNKKGYDCHTDFSKALSSEYLDSYNEFSRQSVKLLSIKLMVHLNNNYQGQGITACFVE